jgi:non-heme chloroperoxidase
MGVVAGFGLASCQYMPHAYEPHSPQISDARTVPLPGAILTFTTQGRGQPVLFVHGNIADLRVWYEQRGPAFKRYQLVSYSRRYHYPNAWDGNGKDYTEANNDQDLLNIIKTLQLGRVHLVGQGSGAQIAAEVALSHPELVRTLVLVEPETANPAVGRPEFEPLLAERTQVLQQIETAVRLEENAKAAQLLFNWASANKGAYDALSPPLQGEILDNASVLPFFLNAPPKPMPCSEFARLTVPTLIVTGDHANAFFAAVADAVAGCIPGAVRETVPNADYVVQRQNPDSFNAVLVGFITTHTPTAD